MSTEFRGSEKSRRRTTLYLLLASGIWVVGTALIFLWKNGPQLELNNIGDFLAGTTAPVAFLWFIAAYYQQSEELRQNTAVLRLQAEELSLQRDELRKQREEAAALVEATREQVFLERAKDRPFFVVRSCDAKGPRGSAELLNVGTRSAHAVVASYGWEHGFGEDEPEERVSCGHTLDVYFEVVAKKGDTSLGRIEYLLIIYKAESEEYIQTFDFIDDRFVEKKITGAARQLDAEPRAGDGEPAAK